MAHILDNIFWNTLSGPQAKFAVGRDDVRRYAPGFSPIIGFGNAEKPNFGVLKEYCKPDEHFYTDGWKAEVPDGWKIEAESTMFKMIYKGSIPEMDEAPDAIALTAEHAPQALELALLTRPGPFGLRTIELGEYFGYFEGTRLMAMAGERTHVEGFREISGVCVHPDFQGRGLSGKLVKKLIRRQIIRGEIPFLHVMRDNVAARSIYGRMGFDDYLESVVRVVSLC